VPAIWIYLFSISKALINGLMIGNVGVLIKLSKGETTLVFNQRLSTKGVFTSGIKMVPDLKQLYNNVVGSKIMIKTKLVEMNKLHKILGHCGETHMKGTAKFFGIKVFRN
jgi:hypothetical protein